MKKQSLAVVFFLLCYVFFLVRDLPANWLLSKVQLPAEVQVIQPSGSIWQLQAKQVRIKGFAVNQIKADLQLLSLLTLDPAYQLSFGGRLLDGPSGQAQVAGLLGELRVERTDMQMAAQELVPFLPLPIDVEALGQLSLSLPEFRYGQPVCQAVQGRVDWQRAAVIAFEQEIELGSLSSSITCVDGTVAITINPENDLGLTFNAYLGAGGQLSGNGYLQPTDRLPAELRAALNFIGRPDNQGRYRLRF